MNKIDFQNGFLCGMATKGLTRSGEFYKPTIYDDPGQTGYIYVNFNRKMAGSTINDITRALIFCGLGTMTITAAFKVNDTTFKVYVTSMATEIHGIQVNYNNVIGLYTDNGNLLPSFSVRFNFTGATVFDDFRPVGEKVSIGGYPAVQKTEVCAIDLYDFDSTEVIAESINVTYMSTITENASVALV